VQAPAAWHTTCRERACTQLRAVLARAVNVAWARLKHHLHE
jgi:hypothetical protein